MKKHIFGVLILFFGSSVWASSQIYSFGQVDVEFWNFETERITISNHCVKDSQLADCEAIRGLKIVSFKRIERAKLGGPNPGALLCEQQLNGFVIVGIDKSSKNEGSFCKLPDSSIVDNGTLIYYSLMNDRNGANKDREPNSSTKKTDGKKSSKKNGQKK